MQTLRILSVCFLLSMVSTLHSQEQNNITIINGDIQGKDILIQSLNATKIFIADENKTSNENLKDLIAKFPQVKFRSFFLFTHGEAGSFYLGSSKVTAKNLFALYEMSLLKNAHGLENLYIYSCNAAAGEEGTALINGVSAQYGIKVAGSTNLTGKNGDWILEAGDLPVPLSVDTEYLGINYPYNLQVVAPGYTLNPILTPAFVTQIAVDYTAGALYYGSTTNALYKFNISTLGLTTVTSDFYTPTNIGWPYVATDLEYNNGFLYIWGYYNPTSRDSMLRVNVGSGLANKVSLPPSPAMLGGYENGMAFIGNKAYFTDGNLSGNTLFSYDFSTATSATLGVGLPTAPYETLEYSPATGQLYFAAGNNLYRVNLSALTTTFVSTLPSAGYAQFALDPTGQYAYTHDGFTVTRINLSTAITNTILTGLGGTQYQDLEIGPSTGTVCGAVSLYVGRGNALYEIKGIGNDVAVTTMTTLSYCQGRSLKIPYTAFNNFCSGNVLTAELSDASGSFASPVAIGTKTTTLGKDTVNAVLPANTPPGTGYKLRVNASLPTLTGITSAITITVTASPTLAVSGSSALCLGGTATLSASGANTYTWSNSVVNSSITVTPSGPASYTVIGTNTITSCVSTQTFSIAVSPAPTISVNSGSVCAGNPFTITPSGAVSYTYSSGSNVVTPLTTTNVSVAGTTSLGCVSSTVAANILVYANPVLSVSSGSICAGLSYVMIPGGATTYTFSGGSQIVTPPVGVSVYTVTGTSGQGCVGTSSAISSVTVYARPVISLSNGTICAGSSFLINPTGASTYTYSGGSALVTPFVTTSYLVSGTSAQGCVSGTPAVAQVIVNPVPVISVNSGSICEGGSFIVSPSGASTYTIAGGSFIVSPLTTTSYSIGGTSALGCVSPTTALVNVLVAPLPLVTVNSGSICAGASFLISPSGAVTYAIAGGSLLVSPSVTTSYSVVGYSSLGCASALPVMATVSVSNLPVITAPAGTVCAGKSFTIIPSGATTYTYSGGSAMVSPSSTSTYTINGSSAAGCISASPALVVITVAGLPTIAVNSGAVCAGKSFTLVPSGASTYTFQGGSAVVTPTATSSYSVTGTNGPGCVSSVAAMANVTVNPSPLIQPVSSSSVMCAGESVSLTASGAISYTWISTASNNTIVSGSGMQVFSPSFSTTYSVTGINQDGCSGSGSLLQVVILCTGLHQEAIDKSVTIYPNPNNGEFTISVNELTEVNIFSSLGQLVFTGSIEEGSRQVDLGQYANGMYLVHLKQTNGTKTVKLIKQ